MHDTFRASPPPPRAFQNPSLCWPLQICNLMRLVLKALIRFLQEREKLIRIIIDSGADLPNIARTRVRNGSLSSRIEHHRGHKAILEVGD